MLNLTNYILIIGPLRSITRGRPPPRHPPVACERAFKYPCVLACSASRVPGRPSDDGRAAALSCRPLARCTAIARRYAGRRVSRGRGRRRARSAPRRSARGGPPAAAPAVAVCPPTRSARAALCVSTYLSVVPGSFAKRETPRYTGEIQEFSTRGIFPKDRVFL